MVARCLQYFGTTELEIVAMIIKLASSNFDFQFSPKTHVYLLLVRKYL